MTELSAALMVNDPSSPLHRVPQRFGGPDEVLPRQADPTPRAETRSATDA